jgi:hypothetical protein
LGASDTVWRLRLVDGELDWLRGRAAEQMAVAEIDAPHGLSSRNHATPRAVSIAPCLVDPLRFALGAGGAFLLYQRRRVTVLGW